MCSVSVVADFTTLQMADQIHPPVCIVKPGIAVKPSLREAFDEGLFSDVTLCCGKNKFPAHRILLAAESTVFRAMFETDMKEAKENQVVIDDSIDPAVVQEMISFTYTGQVEGISEIAADLLEIADKYDMDDLMALCENELSATLNIDNAAEILILADDHNRHSLRKVVLHFISRNLYFILKTDGWKRMLQSHGGLVHTVLDNVAKLLHEMSSAPSS